MPRALSDPEFAQFMADNASAVNSLQPEQSKVISWNGMSVLAYAGANPTDTGQTTWYGTEIYAPDLYLSDISDASQLPVVQTPGYGTAPPQSMLDTIPQATLDTLTQEAAASGVLLNKLGATIGQIAASTTSPLLSNLTVPIVAAVAVLLFMNKR